MDSVSDLKLGCVNIAFLVPFTFKYPKFRKFQRLNSSERRALKEEIKGLINNGLFEAAKKKQQPFKKSKADSETYEDWFSQTFSYEKGSDMDCFRKFEIFHRFMIFTEHTFRFKLDEFAFTTQNIQRDEKSIRIKTFLSIYPQLNAGIIMYNMSLDHPKVKDVIMLKHLFVNNKPWNVNWVGSLILDSNDTFGPKPTDISQFKEYSPPLITYFSDNYLKALKKWLGDIDFKNVSTNAILIEVRNIENDDFSISTFDTFLTKYSHEIYGLLSSDEGWKYIPSEITESITTKENLWTTRRFLRIITKGNSILSITANTDQEYSNYLDSTVNFYSHYNQTAPDYFSNNLCAANLAGLNHGILFVVENVLLEKLNLIISDEFTMEEPKTIRESILKREEFLKISERIPQMRIPEIGQLYAIMRENFGINSYSDEIDKKRKILDTTLEFQYKEMLDIIAKIIAVIAAFVAITQTWTLSIALKAILIPSLTVFFVYLPRIYIYWRKLIYKYPIF